MMACYYLLCKEIHILFQVSVPEISIVSVLLIWTSGVVQVPIVQVPDKDRIKIYLFIHYYYRHLSLFIMIIIIFMLKTRTIAFY